MVEHFPYLPFPITSISGDLTKEVSYLISRASRAFECVNQSWDDSQLSATAVLMSSTHLHHSLQLALTPSAPYSALQGEAENRHGLHRKWSVHTPTSERPSNLFCMLEKEDLFSQGTSNSSSPGMQTSCKRNEWARSCVKQRKTVGLSGIVTENMYQDEVH